MRGGGHNVAGYGTFDDGLVIDLSPMKGLRIDSVRRTALAQPGLRLGEFDLQTQTIGLATPLGIVANRASPGLTLGGGRRRGGARRVDPDRHLLHDRRPASPTQRRTASLAG